MQFSSTNISYHITNSFSTLVNDYLNKNETLQPFYKYQNNFEGIDKAIAERNFSENTRKVLVQYFQNAYSEKASLQQLQNIKLLENKNCFTVTTAHQPNIFTGPLYVIYKIIHSIKLADSLKNKFTNKTFVPVFFMGSEDADLDELGNITIQDKKIIWQTKQSGAVGRMLVDDHFLVLINEIKGQIATTTSGMELSEIFAAFYTKGKSIQIATFELLNKLFADYGLLILVPDDITLKQEFISTIKKEITTSFSHQIVEQTNLELSKHYKTQASGREINLFYLIDDKRERITKLNESFFIENLQLKFTKDEMLAEIESHPERFSPNVILRPVFQETILPNVAFIGGGGELAYWMQLKHVFEAVNIDYPVLVLRNSFLLLNKKQQTLVEKLGLTLEDFFKDENEIIHQYVLTNSKQNINYSEELKQLTSTFSTLKNHADKVDVTLTEHLQSIEVKTIKKIEQAEKKLIRAEKRKFQEQQLQIKKIKSQLFPNKSLQERVENFSFYYSKYGKEFFTILLESSLSMEQEFTIITAEN
jgi:bacillithiol synthase